MRKRNWLLTTRWTCYSEQFTLKTSFVRNNIMIVYAKICSVSYAQYRTTVWVWFSNLDQIFHSIGKTTIEPTTMTSSTNEYLQDDHRRLICLFTHSISFSFKHSIINYHGSHWMLSYRYQKLLSNLISWENIHTPPPPQNRSLVPSL
jgi:hypothetical protein